MQLDYQRQYLLGGVLQIGKEYEVCPIAAWKENEYNDVDNMKKNRTGI